METNIINFTVSMVTDELYPNDRIKFDNAVQRVYVWDIDRQSLLIHSLIEKYPIPPLYVNQYIENNISIYDVLDGKQRLQTIIKFLNDEIRLGELEPIQVYDKKEKKIVYKDISNLTFSELDTNIQKKIENAQLMCISVVASEEEVTEMFFRLNNGKPLSAIEHNRAKSKDLTTIQELGNHKLFTTSLTEKSFAKYIHEETVIKSYVVLYDDNKDLSAKSIKNKIPDITFTNEQKETLLWCFDFIYSTYDKIINDNTDIKLNKRIAKRIITRTHMLSLLPLIVKCKQEKISVETISLFCQEFFAGSTKSTNDVEYNNSASAGSSAPTNVNKRIDRIFINFKSFQENLIL